MTDQIATNLLPNGNSLTSADELPLMLTREEGSSSLIYLDSNKHPSIGIGVNLIPANLPDVLAVMGIQPTQNVLSQFQSDINAYSGSLSTLQNKLDDDVAQYSAAQSTFSLDPSQISALFAATSANAITGLSAILAALGAPIATNTQQFMALASMYFNSPHSGSADLFGPKLLNALGYGDNAQVWYQIRYQSDKNDSNGGIEKRRFYESQVFGLNSTNPSFVEADQAYEMLTEHRATMIAKENTYVTQTIGKSTVALPLGVNPNGDNPIVANPVSVLGEANQTYGLQPGSNVPPVNQAVETLAQTFNPDAEQIAATINAWLSGMIPEVGILNDSMGGTFQVRSTDILIAPDSTEIADGFAVAAQDLIEASDSPTANHILIGPDSISPLAPQPTISLTGGIGNDLLIAGAGNELLFGGSAGSDTLIGGQAGFIIGAAGNDTLEGGAGSDKFVFDAPSADKLTETILPWGNQSGSIELISGSLDTVLNGSQLTPVLSPSDETINWEADNASNGSGVNYSYSKITGDLIISGGLLGSGTTANSIVVDNFNLSAAENGGFLGISLSKSDALNFGSTTGVDPPPPDFNAGATQAYTFSTDTPSDTAQTVTVSLSGVNAADFEALVDNQTVQQNSNGSFSFLLPAGQTNVSFSLTNTGDVGSSGTLQLSASLSDPSNPTLAAVTSNSLTQNFVEPTDDPFSTPQPSLFYGGTATAYGPYDEGGTTGLPYNVYSNLPNGMPVTGTTSGNNYIDVSEVPNNMDQAVGAANDSIDGGSGNDTIVAGFGYAGNNASDGGVNVINGHGGQDIIWSSYDVGASEGEPTVAGASAVRIYANTAVDLGTAIADANSGTATHLQGDLIDEDNSSSTIVGGNGNDLLVNNENNGVIVAGVGDDTILGGVNLSYYVPNTSAGANADNEGLAGQTWSASFSNDQLSLGGNIIYTSSGVNEYTLGQGTAPPAGYEGNVDAYGSALGIGDDTIFGGAGQDVIILSNGNNDVTLGLGNSTVMGGMGSNTIIGGGGNNSIIGGGGSDYIADGSGNSLLVGRGGDNTIIGGSGNDTLLAGSLGSNWATNETGNNYVDGGTGNALIYGSGGNDTLIAGEGKSSVFGGAGNESIVGGDGNDQLVGGNGNDTIDARGTTGTDLIQAGSGNTTIYGGDGADHIQGTTGTDLIYAGDGGTTATPTQIDAGSGSTTVFGGDGVDNIFGGSGMDVLYAGDGGTNTNPTLVRAGTGATTIYGGAGADNLIDTTGGTDSIIAGSGDANLVGTGSDTLVAGSGNDNFSGTGTLTDVFSSSSGNAFIDTSTSTVTLEFTADVSPNDLTISEDLSANNVPELVIQGDGGAMTVGGGLNPGAIQSIVFDDPQTMSLAAFIQQADAVGNTEPTTIAGPNGNLIFDTGEGDTVSGGSGFDTISAWGDNDTLTAGAVNTLIYAEGDDNLVYGGVGADTLVATGASTTLYGGSANELFEINDPTEVIVPSIAGGDTILSSVSYALPTGIDTLTLTGNAALTAYGNQDAANLITGNAGKDILVAGSGADTLVSGSGIDTLEEGAGGDTFVVNNAADVIYANNYGYQDTIQSSVSYVLRAPVDTLILTGSASLTATDGYGYAAITGNAGNDTLIGGSGSDELIAGTGVDTLIAGTGITTFVVNNTADVIEANGTNRDTVDASANYTLANGVDNLMLIGSANLSGSGNSDASNTITGNSGNDTLIAGSGNDVLNAGTGIDTFVAGAGSDTFYGSAGYTYNVGAGFQNVEIVQSNGNGTMQFGPGITLADLTSGVVAGLDGKPALLIADGDSSVTIDDGLNGSINQFDFADGTSLSLEQLLSQLPVASSTLVTSTGDFVLGGTSVSLTGGIGNDTLYAAGPNDTLLAGSGNQLLLGKNAGDVLVGSVGDDTLYGGSGDDTLIGGTGHTVMYGGQADDFYHLTQGGTATIVPNSTAGAEVLYLPQGMTIADFTAYQGPNGELIIQSLSGNTTAIINGFYDATSSNKTWILTDGGDTPQLLSQWAGSQNPTSTEYSQQIAELQQVYSAQLVPTLGDAGEKGGSLTAPQNSFPPNDPNYQYQFNGVNTQSLTVQGGVLNIGSSDNDAKTTTVTTVNTTETITSPVFSTVTTPAYTVFIATGSGLADAVGDSLVTPVYNSSGAVIGDDVLFPAQTEVEQTGVTTTTVPIQAQTTVTNETQGFNVYNVTGDGGNDVITAAGPFVGTVDTGDGNVSVNLGRGNNNGLIGRGGFVGETSVDSLGAFIQAGAGNDTIIGTSGADVIAAGTGFDYLDGWLGTTYYVPLQGDASDVIADDATTAYGENVSPTTLVLPAGVTPQNLQYRVFLDPDPNNYKGEETGRPSTPNPLYQVLQLRYGDSTVLVDFSDTTGDFEYHNSAADAPGVDLFQFADGTILTRAELIAQATLLPNDFNPIVTVNAQSLTAGQTVSAAGFFSATDAPDNPITWYQLSNSGTGGGYFILDGKTQAAGQSFYVSASQSAQLSYVAGAGGDTDSIEVSAFDGAIWSAESTLSITPASHNHLAATGANQLVSGPTTGPDTLTGGFSNDTLAGASGTDTFVFTPGVGALTITDSVSQHNTLTFPSGVTSSEISLGIAADGGLLLRVGTSGDTIDIEGFNAANAAKAGAIQNFVFADGTKLTYAQLLSRGFDIYGGSGNETLTGTNLTDRIYAGSGNDTLIASGQSDTLIGGSGNETFVVNKIADVVQDTSSTANNTIQSSVSYTLPNDVNTLVLTGAGALIGTGNSGNDLLTANSGKDTLIAGSGTDTLVSGTGIDSLVGGSGTDTFIVNNSSDAVSVATSGNDTIESAVSYTLPTNVNILMLTGTSNLT